MIKIKEIDHGHTPLSLFSLKIWWLPGAYSATQSPFCNTLPLLFANTNKTPFVDWSSCVTHRRIQGFRGEPYLVFVPPSTPGPKCDSPAASTSLPAWKRPRLLLLRSAPATIPSTTSVFLILATLSLLSSSLIWTLQPFQQMSLWVAQAHPPLHLIFKPFRQGIFFLVS